VNVYNEANEKIGDINDVVLDKSGKVEKVVLGVGGFLGMGEHYVASPMTS
jgi:sporulation protein YlmC with PRC-barrel domain